MIVIDIVDDIIIENDINIDIVIDNDIKKLLDKNIVIYIVINHVINVDIVYYIDIIIDIIHKKNYIINSVYYLVYYLVIFNIICIDINNVIVIVIVIYFVIFIVFIIVLNIVFFADIYHKENLVILLMFSHSFQISSHETSHKNEKNLIFFTQRNIIFIIFQIIFDERQGDIMYQIVDRDEILSYEDIRNEYQGYLTLVIKNGNDAGKDGSDRWSAIRNAWRRDWYAYNKLFSFGYKSFNYEAGLLILKLYTANEIHRR